MEETKEIENVTEETKGLKAKTVSLWAKIIGGVIIIAGHVLKWIKVLPDATSSEIGRASCRERV